MNDLQRYYILVELIEKEICTIHKTSKQILKRIQKCDNATSSRCSRNSRVCSFPYMCEINNGTYYMYCSRFLRLYKKERLSKEERIKLGREKFIGLPILPKGLSAIRQIHKISLCNSYEDCSRFYACVGLIICYYKSEKQLSQICEVDCSYPTFLGV